MSDSLDSSKCFKLIGLRVMEDCSRMLRKVLHPSTTYFFCNEFEDDEEGSVRRVAGTQELSPDFFGGPTKLSPYVNISCIVGQNGDGKSSVIELLIRTINNFAYMAGFLSDHPKIKFVPGIFTKLYFLVNDEICSIDACGTKMQLVVGGEVVWTGKLGKKNAGKQEKKEVVMQYADKLFYMLVSNYSLYAYNSHEFKVETSDIDDRESWIASLFDKNDAYQTPITISPKRERGIIDINREHGLTLQRLSELFLDCSKGKYRISEREIVEGFAFKLETESKLISQTLNAYLKDEQRGARNTLLLNDSFLKNKSAVNLKEEKVLEENLKFWQSFDRGFYDTGLLRIAQSVMGYPGDTKDYPFPSGLWLQTDLSEYLHAVMGRAKKKIWETARKNLVEFVQQGGECLTFLQFQRLFLVYEVFKYWRTKLGKKDMVFPFSPTKSFSRIEHAFCYLIYKTIRILENYPEYIRGGVKDYEYPQHFFNDQVRTNNLRKWFETLENNIKSKTHFTIKLRQTLLFLEMEGRSLDPSDLKYPPQIASPLEMIGFKHYLDVKTYYERISFARDPAACVPPPFYQIDYLIMRDNTSLYPLSRMSSGERQRLFTSSSIVYHLRNILNSKAKVTKIKYKNVVVVLEEVELYFHPEYQRCFVKYLLDQIENAHLTPDMSVNLLFVTHSPFILSDIPRQNVLFLRNGRPDRTMQEDTFGANIHTLLQNGFFLHSVPIGEFAKAKINRLFSLLNQSEEISPDEMRLLEVEIPLVSEPLLRNQLMRLYAQRKGFQEGDYQRRIKELESRIEYLERRLYDKN